MMRSVLLVVLAFGVGCKSSDQPAAPAPAPAGAATPAAAAATGAGKVLEVSGQVTIAGKPVAVGQIVGADDLVETGDDGRVTIELTHNLAHWQLGPGKHQKVAESIAWKLPRNEGNASVVIQDMTSAGRPAERSAADSVATAPAAPAPTAAPAPATGSRRESHAAPAAPPAPPPPPKAAAAAAPPDLEPVAGEAHTTRGPVVASPAPGGGPSEPPIRVDQMLNSKTRELHACFESGMTMLSVRVEIAADGSATVTTPGASDQVHACVAKIVATLKFPAQKTTASISISR